MGLHYNSRSLFHKILSLFHLGIYLVYLTLAIIGASISRSEDLNYTMECVMTIFLMFHAIGKQQVHRFKQDTMRNLFEKTEKFWPTKNSQDIEKLLNVTRYIINGYLISGCVLALLFCVQPYLTGISPTTMYVPPGCQPLINLSFCWMCWVILTGNLGLDTIFSSFCIQVTAQFKLLQERLRTIGIAEGNEDTWKRIKQAVDHHNFLLDFCDELNVMAGFPIILEFFIAITGLCVQLFITFHSKFSIANKIKCGTYFVVTLIQAALYYAFGEIVSEASREVASGVSASQWYQSDAKCIKAIQLIIMRSQKEVILHGYGLVLANLRTYSLVVKTTLSYYTYLTTMSD